MVKEYKFIISRAQNYQLGFGMKNRSSEGGYLDVTAFEPYVSSKSKSKMQTPRR